MRLEFFLITTLILSLTVPAFAQDTPSPLLSVKVAKDTYSEGETIVISGNVRTVIADTPIIIQIIYKGNFIEVAQIAPAQDGSFTSTVLAQGPLWQNAGEYTIKASYSTDAASEATFNFLTEQGKTRSQRYF